MRSGARPRRTPLRGGICADGSLAQPDEKKQLETITRRFAMEVKLLDFATLILSKVIVATRTCGRLAFGAARLIPDTSDCTELPRLPSYGAPIRRCHYADQESATCC